MTEPMKIPLDSRSHLESIFSKMYESFSQDPLSTPVINWTLDTGDAYLKVSGITATLVMTDNLTTSSTSFNLVNDGHNHHPTLGDFKTWLTDKLTEYFITGFTISWSDSNLSNLTALVLPEGYTNINYPIPMATGLNYLQMRVMALMFDLISSDVENFFTHLSVAGLDNYAPDPKSGLWLDWVGDFYGLNRLGREDVVETNEDYRRRILRMLSRPRENNVAIGDIVGQSIGIWDILVMDYRVFWALLIVFGRPGTPNLVLPLAKSVAPSGIRWTGIVVPGTSGNIGGAIAGRVRAGNSGISYDTSRANSFRKREGWSPDITTDYWDDNLSLPLSGIFFVLR